MTYIIIAIIALALLVLGVFLLRKNPKQGLLSGLLSKKEIEHKTMYEHYESGDIWKEYSEYGDSVKDGEEKVYYPTGQINKICHWKDGRLHGEYVVFFKDGSKYLEGTYKNGRLSGDYIVHNI